MDSAEEGQTVVAKFFINKKRLYLVTRWRRDSFDVAAFDGIHVIKAEASSDLVQTSLKPDGVETAEYINLTRDALSSQDLGGRYSYAFTSPDADGSSAVLSWSIKLPGPTGFALRGSLTLTCAADCQAETLRLIELLLERTSRAEEACKTFEEKTKQASAVRDEATNSLRKLSDAKAQAEQDMYKMFVVVLNEKKRKIRELQARATELEQQLADKAALLEQVQKRQALQALQPLPTPTKQPTLDNPMPDNTTAQPKDNLIADEDENEDEASDGGTLTQATFQNVLGPTPSIELFATADAFDTNVPRTVRKRHKPEVSQHASQVVSKDKEPVLPPYKEPEIKSPTHNSHVIVSPAPKKENQEEKKAPAPATTDSQKSRKRASQKDSQRKADPAAKRRRVTRSQSQKASEDMEADELLKQV